MVNDVANKKSDNKTPLKTKREKLQAPPTKIVIRKLPPTFTEEEFKNAISPLPDNNYFAFFPADRGLGANGFSRAYINFLNAEEIVSFRDRFDGYVFVDQKGNEFPALVEYAPFQKIPKINHQKKDIRCGTIDEDPDYIAFLDNLQNPEVVLLPQIETLLEEIEALERETKANNGVLKVKTPLLEYVEQRQAERFRHGEKRRRKEFDRKKSREEERRKRREVIKEYRRNDHYAKDDRERERFKKKEEEKLKWKEKKEEREKLKKEKPIERYKNEDGSNWKAKEETVEEKPTVKPVSPRETAPLKGSTSAFKTEKAKPQKTKRYSEVRKKDDRKNKEERGKCSVEVEKEGLREEEKVEKEEEANEKEEKKEEPPILEKEKEIVKMEKEEDRVEKTEKEEKVEDVEKEEVEKTEKEEEKVGSTEEEDKKENKEEKDLHTEDKSGNEPREEESSNRKGEEEESKEEKEDRTSKDPRVERRIRNKDRPAMQLYRPGQSRLKTRPKTSDEGGAEKPGDGESPTSSSSASPIMGGSGDPSEAKIRGYATKGYDKKPYRYRESANNYYWESERETRSPRNREEMEGKRGQPPAKWGGRRGYSYLHERETKGKWVKHPDSESQASQVKSRTFRRSTSQE